jgi:hypothetical protein
MSDPALDLSAYEADVIEHVLVGRARARMLEDVRAENPWNVNLERGELEIGDATYRCQILGTFAHESATFLWAWANPGSNGWTGSLAIANELRARGAQPGQAVYAEPEIAAGWVNPNELAYVSGELSGGHPVFVGSYDGGAAFLLVTSLRLDFRELSIAYVPGILLGVPSVTMGDPRACTRRFAERLGFTVTETPSSMSGTRSDGGFLARWDGEGRLAEVSLTASGQQPQ